MTKNFSNITKTGKDFEHRVAQAYRDLGAHKIEHDIEMAGHQIDVYVQTIAESFIRTAGEENWSATLGNKL